MIKNFLALLFVCVGIVSLAFGQGGAGITGVVKDQSGAVIPGVKVTAVQVETGVTRTSVSNSAGTYNIPNLNPGQYKVQAEMTGFTTVVRPNIALKVGDNLAIDMEMQVGTTSEKIEVTSEAPLVETTTAVVGGVVDNRAVVNLPLNGRGFADLAELEPNVILDSTAQRKGNNGFGVKFSINGMRPASNNYTMDGQDVNSLFNDLGNVSGAAAGVDSIREFKVVTSPDSAEIGRTSGGEIQVVTKSGTNSFHGSAYEFLRNDDLDANQWETNALSNGLRIPYRRNQFGASLGGPIKKDKTFVFANYEGLRSVQAATSVFTVPDAAAHAGNLPNASHVEQVVGVAPSVAPYLALYPIPPTSLGNGTGLSPFTGSTTISDNFFLIRGDQVLSSSNQLFARYTQDNGRQEAPSDFLFDNFTDARSKFSALGLTSILSPRAVNNLSLYYNRTTSLNGDLPDRLANPSMFTFTPHQAPEGPIYGDITITGITVGPSGQVGGTNVLTGVANNVIQVRDDLTLEVGRHSLVFGTNLENMQANVFNAQFAGGSFSFQNEMTFMQGTPSSFQAALPSATALALATTQRLFAFHAEDNFRISSHLTLNLGLRYEITTIPTERYNRFATTRDYASINETLSQIQVAGPPFWGDNPSLHDFEPRVGLAWSPDGRTSVRAGIGIFDSLLLNEYWRSPIAYTPPFNVNGTINASGGIPINFPNTFTTQAALLASLPSTWGFVFNPSQPSTAQYSLTIERQLGKSWVVKTGYAGSRGWHLPRNVGNTNVEIPTILPDGQMFYNPPGPSHNPVRNPAFSSIRMEFTDVDSFFNSFYGSIEKRLSAGLTFLGSYTFAHSVDDSSRNVGSTDFTTTEGGQTYGLQPASALRALSTFDVRNTLSANLTYDLPWGSGRAHTLPGVADKVLGDWTANTLVRVTSGSPFGVTGDRDNSALTTTVSGQLASGPPNVVGNENSIHPQDATQYFNPTVFVLPPIGFYGNAGRNTIIGPGTTNVDFSLAKENAITERVKLQFRAEIFNLFNRVNFNPPSGSLFSAVTLQYLPNAGQLTSSKPARQIQLALKLVF